MKKYLLAIVTLIFLSSLFVQGQTVLPNFFSDHMVLQRNSEVNIWGWGRRGGNVQIFPSWSKDTIEVVCDGYSRWSAKLKTPEAGGPYKIKFKNGGVTTALNDIMIGEVWLMSGQSNMEWGAHNKLEEMVDELSQPINSNIRLLHVNRIASDNPQENIVNTWKVASPEILKEFSAIGYFFGKQLNTELNIPIGIISANWGGTNAEVWIPKTDVESNPVLLADAKTYEPHRTRPTDIAAGWNSMMNPLKGYNLAGFCWYQGEANVSNYANYSQLMLTLVNSWRREWGNEKLPFYFVQIAPHPYKQSVPNEQMGALLREQQEELLQLDHTGMVVISDLVPDVKNIHPPLKKDVAKRLSNLAFVDVYGKKIKDYKSPVYNSHVVKGNKIVVSFKYTDGSLKIKDGALKEIYVAGKDGIYKEAEAKVDGKTLVIFNESIKDPKYVKFGFSDIAIPNLFNASDLPVAPFRIK